MGPVVLDASAAVNIALKSQRAAWLLPRLAPASVVSAPDLF